MHDSRHFHLLRKWDALGRFSTVGLVTDFPGQYDPTSPIPIMLSDRQFGGATVSRTGRVMLFAWAVFLIGGFGLARSLDPDPRGFGTHRQVGLPECTFRLMFSRPCPGCGMTTCFSHFVRGEFAAAAQANTTGLLLAIVCALMIPWSLVSAARGRLWFVDDPIPVCAGLMVALGVTALALWSWRLWFAI